MNQIIKELHILEDDIYKAQKIIVLQKGVFLIVFIKDEENRFRFYRSKDFDFLSTNQMVDKIISLLIMDYSMEIIKTRSGLIYNKKILDKYIKILKRYKGQKPGFDDLLEGFIGYYLNDDAHMVRQTMAAINDFLK